MSLFRPWAAFVKRFTFSVSKFAAENANFLSPSKQTCYIPIFKTNLPSLVCVCEKKTIAEELGIPEPPKKPMPGFFLFVKDKTGSYPHLAIPERMKRLKQDWSQLKESEKMKYDDDFTARLRDYQLKYKAYMESLSSDQKEQIRLLRSFRIQEKVTKKARRERQRLLKEAGKPDHPGTAITVFYKQLNHKETIQGIQEKWRQLPEEEKEAYKMEARKQLTKYREELALWQQRMKESGREDLLD